MKMNNLLEVGGNSLMYILTAVQTNEIFQLISLILSIAISVVILIGKLGQLIVKLHNWWKNAKKDGKITQEEIQDGVNIAVEGINDIKDTIKDKEENKNDI